MANTPGAARMNGGVPGGERATRTVCVWCPGWSVVVAGRADPSLVGEEFAVVEGGVVRAASPAARAESVHPGMRRREAEACCPGLRMVEADLVAEVRAFEEVAGALDAITPRLEVSGPGTLVFPSRGPSRYFGGDAALAEKVVEVVREVGVDDVRVGVADGVTAARLVARAGGCVVAPGESAAFLAPWPVAVLGHPELAGVLHRLGLGTVGAFAALDGAAVLARFGAVGREAHLRARGMEPRPSALADPPPDLVEAAELDPPADRVDAAAFVGKAMADRFVARLAARGWVCTRVVVEAETEHGEARARCWRHDGPFTAAALAERVRWQLDGWLTATGGLTGALTLLRLVPDEVVADRGRQLGFWGGDAAAADRAVRVLARVQGMVGPEAVVTAVAQGGRTPGERVRWVPWGEPREESRHRPVGVVAGPVVREEAAWPGVIPGPAPSRIPDPPVSAELLDDRGRPVRVSARGEASAAPAVVRCPALDGGGGAVRGWAGPWPQDVRWWDRPTRSRCACWLVVVEGGCACLVRVAGGQATLEAIYD